MFILSMSFLFLKFYSFIRLSYLSVLASYNLSIARIFWFLFSNHSFLDGILVISVYERVLSWIATIKFQIVHFQYSLSCIISYNNYLNKCNIQFLELFMGFYLFLPWWTIVLFPLLLETYFIAFSSSSWNFYR